MKRLHITLLAILMLLLLTGSAYAWTASVNIAAVDDEGPGHGGVVYSPQMGTVVQADLTAKGMTGTLTRVEPANVNTATLANYDSLLLFNCDPAVFNAGQKADIVAFVKGGGKLVIWDSEDQYSECGGTGCWDYSWLPTPFSQSVPGAQGATGSLTIVEENELSTNAAGPYFIDANMLSTSTDAVGDANVFTSFVAAQWCTDMTAKNVLQVTGPVHVYTKGPTTAIGNGIIIYSGLDWDYAGFYGNNFGGEWLNKMMAQEFNAASLPCTVPPPQFFTVTKTSDKTQYNAGDDIVFDISVTNSGQITSEDTVADDLPPAEITCPVTHFEIGDLTPGQTWTTQLTCVAMTPGCGLTNSVVATGYYQGQPIFTGSDSTDFNIGNCNNVPEFPTLAVPVAALMGMVFIIYSLKARKD